MTTLTVGDTATNLAGEVDANLTGILSIVLHAQRPDGEVLVRPLQVVSAAAGTWKLPAWTEGDLNEQGWYELEVRVVFADGSQQTFWADDEREVPVKVWVRNPLAA